MLVDVVYLKALSQHEEEVGCDHDLTAKKYLPPKHARGGTPQRATNLTISSISPLTLASKGSTLVTLLPILY